MITRRLQLLVIALFVVLARPSLAQNIATIAASESMVEIGRGGTWTPASIGAALQAGDQLRSNATGRASIVFQDGSVLNVGTNTQLVIEKQSIDAQGAWHSLIRLLRGKILALVNESYQRSGSLYEIETPTAVSGVHGTEFVMTYDPVGDVSQVVGVTGTVDVHSVMDRQRRGVAVTAQEITVVARRKFPTPPERVPPDLFRQYIEDLQFIGGGRPESLAAGHGLLAGTTVPPPDRPGPVFPPLDPWNPLPGQPTFPDPDPSGGGITGQPPGQVGNGSLGINF